MNTARGRILVTGGAGFIGSNACIALRERGYDVVSLDNLSLGTRDNLPADLPCIEGDVRNADDLAHAGSVDYIIHLAGASSAPMFAENLADAVSNNVNGHVAVLEFARRTGAKKVLFASTSSIYGNNPLPLTEDQSVTPPNFYAVTKHTMEELSRVYSTVHGMEIIAFRFMSVYGPREEHKGRFANLVSQFIWGMEAGKRPVLYGDGTQERDFTNVRDVVGAFMLAIGSEKRFGFDVYNVGTSTAVSLRDLVGIINAARGSSFDPAYIENPIASTYVAQQQADLSRIEASLGYHPAVTLAQGIAELVAYRKEHPTPPVSLSF